MQGHAKKLSNGLDAHSMKKSYGKAQPNMRESIMKQHDGNFGMHSRTLEVGDTQSLKSFLPLRALLECETKQFQN
jgi:hypothetical protein